MSFENRVLHPSTFSLGPGSPSAPECLFWGVPKAHSGSHRVIRVAKGPPGLERGLRPLYHRVAYREWVCTGVCP